MKNMINLMKFSINPRINKCQNYNKILKNPKIFNIYNNKNYNKINNNKKYFQILIILKIK